MFLVKDSSSSREERILQMLVEDASISLLLSIIHFEWTIRRAIIALGTSPNVDVRKKLRSCHGTRAYKEIWKEEVSPRIDKRLPEIVKNWEGLIKAFNLRHRLVHGICSCGQDYAKEKTLFAIEASRNIGELCCFHDIDLNARLPIRRRKSLN